MSVAVDRGEKAIVYCKGAPETLLPLCLLTQEQLKQIEGAVALLSQKGRRVLAVACKDEEKPGISEKADTEVERGLTFLGFVALADPPKDETILSIKMCKAAGIKVVMITGDHPVTANAIAKELGIPDPGTFDEVMTGQELNSLKPEELKMRVEKTAVYARVTPEHKLRIIEALQGNGHTVSMTGDGVNDAPALKKASIGVAMGKAGTEVARQAASMVLTDDNFVSIVLGMSLSLHVHSSVRCSCSHATRSHSLSSFGVCVAIEEGRTIYNNIQKFVFYLLSTNVSEVLLILVGVVLDTLQQVESYLLMKKYEGLMESGRVEGRQASIAN